MKTLRQENQFLQVSFYERQTMIRPAKTIAATCGINFSESFHRYKEELIPTKKGEHPMLETNRIIHGQTQGFLSKNKIFYRLFMTKHNKGLFMTKHKSF